MRKHRHHKIQRTLRSKVNHENIEHKVFYALLIIIAIIIGFFVVTTYSSKPANENDIFEKIAMGQGAAFLRDNQIDTIALEQFDQKYYQLKSQNGISSDFYVYFEDQNGNIIDVDGQKCFGYENAKETNPKCR